MEWWSELAKILGKNVTLAKCPPLASPRVAIFETGLGKGHPKGGPCRSMGWSVFYGIQTEHLSLYHFYPESQRFAAELVFQISWRRLTTLKLVDNYLYLLYSLCFYTVVLLWQFSVLMESSLPVYTC